MKTALQHFGEAGLTEAWNEFLLADPEDGERFDPHSVFSEVFNSWLIFHWLPDPNGTDLPPALWEQTAAQVYLAQAGRRLDPIAHSYIEAACSSEFSFHEALEVRPGSGMRMRDVLLDEEHEVHERSGSQNLAPGDMLFAKLVPVDGLMLIEAMGPAAVPPSAKPAIIGLRKKIAAGAEGITVERLHDWDIEIRDLYLDIAEDVLDPAPPDIRNSDGDPFEMHTLHYELDAPSAAFDALKDLATGRTQQDLESGARRDDAGELLSAEVPWVREDNVSLGTIKIEGTHLKAEVNSAERARQAKAQAELAATPEVRAAIDQRMRMHYSSWPDTALPALGGRTPRAAVADADGREAVEALIRSIERSGATLSPPLDPAIVTQMRETLGLAGG